MKDNDKIKLIVSIMVGMCLGSILGIIVYNIFTKI